MRQIQIQKPGGLENLKLENVDSPSLKDNEVLMKISASSLNYHDLMVALGLIPTDDGRVLLGDAAGEVVEIGTAVKNWKVGDRINLERAMKIGNRLDGHIVQGHVDQIGICKKIVEENGSWYFSFKYEKSEHLTIEKGSIAINGVSLTVVNSSINSFSVAIIPYTYNYTNFKNLKPGDLVNIEFDMVGKYISKIIKDQS